MTDSTADGPGRLVLRRADRTRACSGRRVVIFGHDSMGMETALAHVIPTRRTFGLEITRLDMKLLADMLAKGAYDKTGTARPCGRGSTSTSASGWTCASRRPTRAVRPVAGHVPDRPRPDGRPERRRRRLHEPARMGQRPARPAAAGGRRHGEPLQLHLRPQRPQAARCPSPPRPTCRAS